MHKVASYDKRLRCAKTAEQIDVVLSVETLGGPRNIATHSGTQFSTQIECGVCEITSAAFQPPSGAGCHPRYDVNGDTRSGTSVPR